MIIQYIRINLLDEWKEGGRTGKTNARSDREENVVENYERVKNLRTAKREYSYKTLLDKFNCRSGRAKDAPRAIFRYWRIVLGVGCLYGLNRVALS